MYRWGIPKLVIDMNKVPYLNYISCCQKTVFLMILNAAQWHLYIPNIYWAFKLCRFTEVQITFELTRDCMKVSGSGRIPDYLKFSLDTGYRFCRIFNTQYDSNKKGRKVCPENSCTLYFLTQCMITSLNVKKNI